MKIFLLLCLLVITSSLIGKKFFYTAKRNLFKDQEAWSGKDIKIKYSNSNEISESKITTDNYLKIIAEESKIYLDDQSMQESEWNQLHSTTKRLEIVQIK